MFANVAMEHICREPFVNFVDYGRLSATSRCSADIISHCTAVVELCRHQLAATMQCGFDLAVFHICRDALLNFIEYDKLHASSLSLHDTVLDCIFGNDMDVASDYDSSTESETSNPVWMLTSTH